MATATWRCSAHLTTTEGEEAVDWLASAKDWARRIRRDVVTVYFAARHPETPLLVRLLALAVAAYALSPIDLIPDFVPVLGWLDDLLIVPLGLVVVLRLLPHAVLVTARAQAAASLQRPRSLTAATAIVLVWIACAAGLAFGLAPR